MVSTPETGVNIDPFSVPLMYTAAPAVPEKPETVFAKDGAVFSRKAGGVEFLADSDILDALRRILGGRDFRADPSLPPLQGGAIGYLAYDYISTFEPRVKLTPEAGTPTAAFIAHSSTRGKLI